MDKLGLSVSMPLVLLMAILASLQTAVMTADVLVLMLLLEDILGSSRIVAMQLGHVRVLLHLKNNESFKNQTSGMQELPGEWQKGYVNRMKRPS